MGTEHYDWGVDAGKRDASVYGESHPSRYSMDGKTGNFAQGYRDGYERYLACREAQRRK